MIISPEVIFAPHDFEVGLLDRCAVCGADEDRHNEQLAEWQAVDVAAHMPGQHDQKRHAGGAATGSIDDMPVAPDLTLTHAAAIKSYVDDEQAVNGMLRAQDVQSHPLDDPTRQTAYHLQSAVHRQYPVEEDLTVWRGVEMSEASNPEVFRDGAEVQGLGFTSTSADIGMASAFAGDDGSVIRVVIPKGMRAINVDKQLEALGQQGWGEGEVLLAAGARFQVTRADDFWTFTVVED